MERSESVNRSVLPVMKNRDICRMIHRRLTKRITLMQISIKPARTFAVMQCRDQRARNPRLLSDSFISILILSPCLLKCANPEVVAATGRQRNRATS